VQRAAFTTGHLPWHRRRGERHSVLVTRVEADLEGVLARSGEGQVEHEDRTGLDLGDAGWGLAELHSPVTLEQGGAVVVHEPDAHRVVADLAASATDPQDQVCPGVNGRELGHPDVLEQPQDRELSLLVDQGVISQDSEVEEQVSSPGWR
jgi:hypothetical protein